jgi:hypothetical protein
MRFASKRKAQMSMEFMLIFVLMLAVTVVVAAAVVWNTSGVYLSTMELEAREVLSVAKGKLDTAFLEGDGFSTTFTLPQKILNYNYSISISSRFVVLDAGNQTYSAILLSNSTSGSLKKGQNSVRNVNGQLVIS